MPMIKIVRSVFNSFSENTYIVYDDSTLDAVVLDPGAQSEKECERLIDFIEENKLKLKFVLATHGHFDHIMAHEQLCDRFGARFAMSPTDEIIDGHNKLFSQQMGMPYPQLRKIDLPLHDGDTIDVGPIHFEVYATPGHTPGGLSFYLPSEKVLFSGDTLFKGSIGRTDFPLGSYPDLMKSIIKKLMTLPMDTEVLTGHGDRTTLASERDSNPFINDVIDGDVDATI